MLTTEGPDAFSATHSRPARIDERGFGLAQLRTLTGTTETPFATP